VVSSQVENYFRRGGYSAVIAYIDGQAVGGGEDHIIRYQYACVEGAVECVGSIVYRAIRRGIGGPGEGDRMSRTGRDHFFTGALIFF
jgi:hypothetical protein